MSPLIEANLIKLGGISLSRAKLELSIGAKNGKPGGATLPLSLRDLGRSPSPLAVLSWHTRSSAFFGRAETLADLSDWCASGAKLSLRTIVGDGGVGKSRLAAELALRMRSKVWDAGLAVPSSPQLQNTSQPRLLILGYADEDLKDLEIFLFSLSFDTESAKRLFDDTPLSEDLLTQAWAKSQDTLDSRFVTSKIWRRDPNVRQGASPT